MTEKKKPHKKPGKTLDDLLAEKYTDDAMRQFVKDDVTARGTEQRIVSGELKLPHPQDVELHMSRQEAAKPEDNE